MSTPDDWESKVSTLKHRGMLIPRTGIVVHKSNGSLPPGSVPLTPQDLRAIQTDRLKSWIPQEEVWPLRYGSRLLAMVSGVTGYYVMSQTAKYFCIMNHRIFLSILPTTCIPPVLVYLTFENYINQRILMNPFSSCPVCFSLRGSLIQVGIGVVYPLITSTIIALSIAHVDRTYPVPYPTDWRRLLFCFKENVRCSRAPFLTVGCLNLLLGAFVAGRCLETHFEMLSTDKSAFLKEHDDAY